MPTGTLRQPDVEQTVAWMVRVQSANLATLLQDAENHGWQPAGIFQTYENGCHGHILMQHQNAPMLSRKEREAWKKQYGLDGFSGRIIYHHSEYLFVVPDFSQLTLPNEGLSALLMPLQ